MQENFELVQRGFRILVGSMSEFIGQEINRVYRNNWWNEVLNALYDQRDLPLSGSYGDLVDALDIANCIRLIDRKWNDVFRNTLPLNCRTWAKELMGVRNIVAHIGQQDLEQPMAERALDTMALLCREIDPDGADEIREIYRQVRAKAEGGHNTAFSGLAQPECDSNRGSLQEGSLLRLVGTDMVRKTPLTRKVTYAGKTVVYPVYQVRLDVLFYNDQNDRISTWISQYESENGKESLSDLNVEIYNRIIENFITESNPDAIQKTQKNIGTLKGRARGSGTGNTAVFISQNHLPVGADVNEQRQLLQRIKSGSNHAAHGIAADEACNVGQHPDTAVCCQLQCFRYSRHIRRCYQRLGVDVQQQMVHGGIARN